MEQDEVPECRICRCEGDEERPLFYPCACTGSIKWCHESCLVEWIKVSRSREYCETCGIQLSFKNIYADATPARLPPHELTWLGLKRAAREVPYVLRVTVVGFVWLIVVPIWSASAFNYIRPLTYDNSEEPASSWLEWFSSRANPINFNTWESGVWILLAGFFWLFTLVTAFDFVRGFEAGEYATELEALRRRQQNHDNNDGEEADQQNDGAAEPAVDILGDVEDDLLEDEREPGMGEDEAVQAPNILLNGFGNAAEENNNGLDGERANDAIDDFGADQLGFDEWIGLRGPWYFVVNNVVCLCFCVMLFLVTFYVIPESLGRGIFRELNRHKVVPRTMELMSTAGNSVANEAKALSSEIKVLFPEVFDIASEFQLRKFNPLANVSLGVPSFVLSADDHPLRQPKCYRRNFLLASAVHLTTDKRLTCPANLVQVSVERFEQSKAEATYVIVGLLITMLLIQTQFTACHFSWRTVVSRLLRANYPMRGYPHFAWKSIVRSTRTVARVQKVVGLFVFKTFAFPIFLGMLLDAALRPALMLSATDRTLFVADYPHLAVLLLWVAGITHTLLVTMNVIIIRDILHYDVLDGIIRMRNPHGNQYLPLLVEPLVQQMKRITVTCLIYTVIILFFVYIPFRITSQFGLLPLPISIRIFSYAIQVPVECTLFHMWMAHVLEKCKPTLVAAQRWFFTKVCGKLGLTSFLLPVPKNPAEYQAAKIIALVRAGQLHWLDSEPRVSVSLLHPRSRPSYLHLRLIGFFFVLWVVWFSVALGVVTIPFLVGVGAVSCLPTLPQWVRTDIRLYFVGWVLMRYAYLFGPRALTYVRRILQYVSRDFKASTAFSLASLYLGTTFPITAGIFVFLETSLTNQDFPAEQFEDANMLKFIQVMMRNIPLRQAWFAGLPFIIVLTAKTIIGKRFCRAVLEGRFRDAFKIAMTVFAGSLASLLGGIFLGLELWHRARLTSSPLSTVRVFVCLGAAVGLLPPYLPQYYATLRESLQHVHDKLKDDKYLLGRRLSNYDPRVV